MKNLSLKIFFGIEHELGLFENDDNYTDFITQGAKKYCYRLQKKYYGKKKIIKNKIIKNKKIKLLHDIKITIAGVPKNGAKAIKKMSDFKDNLIFPFELTNKNVIFYTENQCKFELIDYLGEKKIICDKSGCCLIPTTYELGKSLEYTELISDNSSKRATFKE